jgi:hypothetical protein
MAWIAKKSQYKPLHFIFLLLPSLAADGIDTSLIQVAQLRPIVKLFMSGVL